MWIPGDFAFSSDFTVVFSSRLLCARGMISASMSPVAF